MNAVEQLLKPLMLLGLAGDRSAQRQLLQGCAERLRDYYRRRLRERESDVEDLVQETLIAIHQRRASYDSSRPFTVWLHAIARYKLADYLRAHYRRRTVPLGDTAELISNEYEAAELGVSCDVERLLGTLPEAQQQVIRMTRMQGLSVAETAALTGHSPGNVKVLAHRGMKAMMERARMMEQ